MSESEDAPCAVGAEGVKDKTEWRGREQPRFWFGYFAPLPLALFATIDVRRHAWGSWSWLPVLLLAVLVGLSVWSVHRQRVRLTDEGIEVRRLRTRVIRWDDITSVEVAPEYEAYGIWLRTRGMHPQARPDELPVPRGKRPPGDTTFQDAVRVIRARMSP